MATTIQISQRLQQALNKKKLFDRETYEEIIWDLLEDTMELSDETKKNIECARAEFRTGKYYSHEEVKRRLGV